jgi:diadenosine tetraphosphate (Ap4A) HIT family hydrolase
MKDCLLCGIDPETNPTYIDRSEHWTILINYMQPTLGSTLLVLNRHVDNLFDLTDDEYLDNLRQVKRLESALHHAFNPNNVNYLMLANVVTHVHYHVIPRYESPPEFADKVWSDENYGHTPILSSDNKDRVVLDLIIQKLKFHL